MVDHSPWRDLAASLTTLSRLSDHRVLRTLSTTDAEALRLVTSANDRGDDALDVLLRERPAWCVRTAIRHELSIVRELISGARKAAEAGERLAVLHPGVFPELQVDLPSTDGDELAAMDIIIGGLRERASTVGELAERAGLPLLTLLLAPSSEIGSVEQLLDRRPRLLAQGALRTLIARAWPSGPVNLGNDVLSADVKGVRKSDGGLTLEVLEVQRSAVGFKIRLRQEFDPELAAEARERRKRLGVSRSYMWPGPITATDAADQMYALVYRDMVSSTPAGTVSVVDLTYLPALDSDQLPVRLCCDRYEIQEFEIRPASDGRPKRTVTERAIDLCLEVTFPLAQGPAHTGPSS